MVGQYRYTLNHILKGNPSHSEENASIFLFFQDLSSITSLLSRNLELFKAINTKAFASIFLLFPIASLHVPQFCSCRKSHLK